MPIFLQPADRVIDGEWIYEVVDGRVFVKLGDTERLTLIKNWQPEAKTGAYVPLDLNRYETLKDQLQRGGEALYFSHCKSNETWLPQIEKAYAKAHGDYHAIEGGFASEGIEDLTGGVASMINPEDIMDKERFWREQLSQVNEKYLFGGGSKTYAKKALVGSHAYAVGKTYCCSNTSEDSEPFMNHYVCKLVRSVRGFFLLAVLHPFPSSRVVVNL